MAVRHVLVSALLALVAVPAHANDAQKGIYVDAEYAATVVSERESALDAMVGACGYTALLVGNAYRITFGGSLAVSVKGVVWLTYVKCTISDGAGRVESTEFAGAFNVGYSFKSGPTWRSVPATLCVEGFAVHSVPLGPVQNVYLDRICETRLGI